MLSVALATGFLAGCIPSTGVPAPISAGLLVPESFQVYWSIDFNERDDQIGAVLLLDAVVFDLSTGVPMDNIQMEWSTNFGGAYLIPDSAVKIVPPPRVEDEATCDVDGDGVIDSDAPSGCSWTFDADTGQYYEFSGDFSSDYHPTYMIGKTDNSGRMRVYLYIDQMPIEEESEEGIKFGAITTVASLGHTAAQIFISPGAE